VSRTPPSLSALRALSAAVDSAIDVGLVSSLLERPASARELAEQLDLDPVGVERTLFVLVGWGYLEDTGGKLRVNEAVRPELAGPDGQPFSLKLWRHVPRFVRTGETLFGVTNTEQLATLYAEHIPRLTQMFTPLAEALAVELAPRFAADVEILDVGAGGAPWSLSLLDRLPDASLVALDLPPVVEHARAGAIERGLDSRVSTMTGDYHAVALDADRFDVALLANVLHLESPQKARALLARAASAVRPGGHVVVIDALDPLDDDARAARAAYALHLALRVPGGFPHAETDLRTWMKDAGLAGVERIKTRNHFGGALLARRPLNEPGGDS
jgi:2-polyprenyl-3-methyl-5-hydroxy-6-metoxy-1,4-benzoquinol methylase